MVLGPTPDRAAATGSYYYYSQSAVLFKTFSSLIGWELTGAATALLAM